MRLQLIAVGRLKDGPERALCERYRERSLGLARGLGFSGPDVIELAESRGRRTEERRREEAQAILATAGDGLLIALDERGRSRSSEEFAQGLGQARDSGTSTATLVIGGADGLDESVRERARQVLCFGALTVPHQLVRVLALEQLYRALTILSGHPYHRA